MSVAKRVLGLPVRIGGEQHSGWLPVRAAQPLPTPIRDVLMDIEIEFDGYGYLLCYQSRDGSVYGDTWHETLAEAEQTAANSLGVQPSHWRDD
jgi:hypothetical protein